MGGAVNHRERTVEVTPILTTPLDPEEQPEYRVNRDLVENAPAYTRIKDDAIERRSFNGIVTEFIPGEERPIVSGGAMLGWYRQHNFRFIRFMRAQRRAARFGEPEAVAALRPGHPVCERLRAGWEKKVFGDEAQVLREIDEMIDQMRANATANTLLLSEDDDTVRTSLWS